MQTKQLTSLLAMLMIPALSIVLNAGTPAGTFTLVSHGTVGDCSAYMTAIQNADMESYRYQDQRCTIEFDNGVKIELISAREMMAQGHTVSLSDYKTTDNPNWIQPIFHLNTDGTLSAVYTKPNLKQRTQSNQ